MLGFSRTLLKAGNNTALRSLRHHNPCRFFSKIKPQNPIDTIRNFCIIAHIDHGKSTLADRLLEITGTITKLTESTEHQYLDKLKVERERGITVKAQTASMYHQVGDTNYLLNLVDTPGHVDFTYEVSRSMRSCRGAILLVDAAQGVQAQTISNFELAKKADLKIIPVLNKIDLVSANVEACMTEMVEYFGVNREDVHKISARTGLNVAPILQDVIDKIPAPVGNIDAPFRGLVLDSWFEKNRGVITLVQVVDGHIKKGDGILSHAFQKRYDLFEVGIMNPEMKPQPILTAGQVGYFIMNMKTAADSRIGDTFYKEHTTVEIFPGFQPAKAMVFAGIYPEDPGQYLDLDKAIFKLVLTDPSVRITKESSATLGHGFRCGFLGLLHMDVFKQRLDDEYEIPTLLTVPSVSFKCKLKTGELIDVDNALYAPDPVKVQYYEEPFAEGTLMFPKENLGDIIPFCIERRGEQVSMRVIDDKKVVLKYMFPMSEVITDFFDKVKSMTKGYGSFEFEFKEFRKSNIQKMVIMLMGEDVDSLSFMIHESRVEVYGRKICKKLKENIPQQQFPVIIQAKVGKKVLAREEVSMLKKNVTAKCYGGDYSRKKKLLDRQKEGKKFLRKIGRVEVSKETFLSVLKVD